MSSAIPCLWWSSSGSNSRLAPTQSPSSVSRIDLANFPSTWVRLRHDMKNEEATVSDPIYRYISAPESEARWSLCCTHGYTMQVLSTFGSGCTWTGPGILEAFWVVVLVALRHLGIFLPHHPPPHSHYTPHHPDRSPAASPPDSQYREFAYTFASLVSHLLVSSVQLPGCLRVQRPAPPARRHGVTTLQG